MGFLGGVPRSETGASYTAWEGAEPSARFLNLSSPCLFCEELRCAFDPPEIKVPDGIDLKAEQKEDSFCKVRTQEFQSGRVRTRQKFYVHPLNEILYRKVDCRGSTNLAVVVPKTVQEFVLIQYHDSPMTGHKGINLTLDMLRPKYWWHRMKIDVTKYINSCLYCQQAKKSRSVKPAPVPTIKTLPVKELVPFQMMGIDLIIPDKPSTRGVRYIIIAVDLLTKYTITHAVKTQSARTLVDFLFKKVICFASCPQILLSDRGRNLTSKHFTDYCKSHGIQNRFTARFHPQANGIVERRNQELKLALRPLVGNNHANWERNLALATLTINCHVSSATGFSPFYLVFGREPNLPLDNKLGVDQIIFRPDPEKPEKPAERGDMRPAWEIAFRNLLRTAERAKKET